VVAGPASSGKHFKPTAAQTRRRREYAAARLREGYSQGDIARATGVGQTAISKDRQVMERFLAGVPARRGRRSRAGLPPLEPYDWISEPPEPDPEPAYRILSPLRAVEQMLASLREANALNRLAHNVIAASEARDTRWLTKTRATLAEAVRYVNALQAVAEDEFARQDAARSLAARDDLRSPVSVNHKQPLPATGSGVLPGKIYAELWRRHHAGRRVGEIEIGFIARGQGTSEARIREAVAEWRVLYPDTLV
jgi:hypothetical protein